jgi:uncharacterized LabA/DUF88 family protein
VLLVQAVKRAAVLLDGDQVRRHIRKELGREPVPADVVALAHGCVAEDEDLFRIYYYDCLPYDRPETHPISHTVTHFAESQVSIKRRAFYEMLARMECVAFRKGVLGFKGWRFSDKATAEIVASGRPVAGVDLVPDFVQKRVDMKIGLDVAWLSSKRIGDRIILVTADSDFIPAMKFARREGVQIVLVRLRLRLKTEMLDHADFVRDAPAMRITAAPPPEAS